jgi:hypothetical protein
VTDQSLEALFQRAVKSGRLNHLSLAWCGTEWEVTFRGVDDRDHHYVRDKDAVVALNTALSGNAPRRKVNTSNIVTSTDFEDVL